MEVILQIPDEVAAAIRNGSDEPVARRVLELAAIQAHEADLITEQEVIEMLGLADREELYAFFKRYNVRHPYSMEDLASDRATLAKLLERQ